MSEKDVQITEIKEAMSGNVAYSQPIVIHQTSKTKVTVVPFYIPRSSGKELSIKIITEHKGKPPMDWIFVEEKSTSLDTIATVSLYSNLKKFLALSEQEDNGEYIILKPGEDELSVGNHGPEEVADAVLSVLNKPDIAEHLVDKELSNELLTAFRSSIRIQELRSAVAQLRNYLESGVKDEQIYQQWCEEHPWAFGNSVLVNDEVRGISASDSVDLMLPSVFTGFRDLVELKRPDMEVLNFDKSHNNYYFTSDVSKVIGQCHRY